ncbi:TetR/AcrR family transcriptional regulator [Aeromicrobium tamlense]|uniref:AcrR family transcriptional regulator n=1 Tax=Aeromicrobium tamlense TaxID=375541 RepID=A0A8I0FTW7_9ACTN|nr:MULTISPECIES: TetR/AcrR family transcriptional regulator [Aeromicrobium]MBD1268621.1 TetR/AcrR family transcriptional regulator [Aeromicrobium tamlense]NYI37472.1 AcrR family transcriptional regulator [Aeromicrobium tamlense]
MAPVHDKQLTERGRRTRDNLLHAASVVFARQGFLDTKITDITTEAGTANGSFYNYFDSKEDIFRAAIAQVNGRMFEVAASRLPEGASPYERIEAATRRYVEGYKADAGMIMILEQVATFSPEFKAMRRETRTMFRARTERGIRRWQEAGVIDPALPAQVAADALTSMVSNFCYMWLVFDEDYDTETVVTTLSRMWAQALGLPVPD